MNRLMAAVMAGLFAVGVLAPAAFAQGTTTKEAPKSDSKAPAKPADKKPAEKKKQVDINSASADELKALDGIGEAYSKKIIENRPYARKDELVKKNVIPQATYDKVKDQIVARQDTAKKEPARKDPAPAAKKP